MPRRRASLFPVVLILLILGSVSGAGAEADSEDWGSVESWLTTSQIYDPPEPHRQQTVILLHGFGGSPFDLKPLALALRGSGFRLVIPVLPGETTSTPARTRGVVTAEEKISWLEGLIAEETERFSRTPHLVGFSMGGSLATIVAVQETLDRLVLVSPYYALSWGNSFLPGLSRFFSSLLPVVPKPWKGQVNDPEGYRRYRPGSGTVSLHGFHRLQQLAERARNSVADLPPLPTLVLASPDDEVASYTMTRRLFLGRPETEFLAFPGSNHILFYDYGRDRAITSVKEFLERERPAQE
jgi:esterase/lipase